MEYRRTPILLQQQPARFIDREQQQSGAGGEFQQGGQRRSQLQQQMGESGHSYNERIGGSDDEMPVKGRTSRPMSHAQERAVRLAARDGAPSWQQAE